MPDQKRARGRFGSRCQRKISPTLNLPSITRLTCGTDGVTRLFECELLTYFPDNQLPVTKQSGQVSYLIFLSSSATAPFSFTTILMTLPESSLTKLKVMGRSLIKKVSVL